MKTHLVNPFKPSKFTIFSTLVAKVTSLLNNSLTIKQVNQCHGLMVVTGLNYLEPVLITQVINTKPDIENSDGIVSYVRSLVRHSRNENVVARMGYIEFLYKCGAFKEVLGEYVSVQRLGVFPSVSVVACGINACTRLGDRVSGILLHGHVHRYGLDGDVHVGSALVGFYEKFDDMENVSKCFEEMSERNTVSRLLNEYLEAGNLLMVERVFSDMGNNDEAWNTMVSWYTRMGDMEKAIDTFGRMRVRNSASWVAMVGGYVDIGNMEIARNFYDVMPEQNVLSCVKMIDGYSEKGAVESAREVFNEMDEKDHLVYNAMITCYAQNGRLKEALQVFDEMLQPNVTIRPDNMTLATVISICSHWGNLSFGFWIENTLMKQMRITMDDHLATAFIDLYVKCGRVDKAYDLFYGLQKKDVSVYTTMILACSRNGRKHHAVKLFEEMLEANICPNSATFSGLLSALNYVGMLEESYHDFNSVNPPPPHRPLHYLG
ncbi:Pentatricopeptide repeat-containing protein [Artemisia annua]|uniref:Pentatricopeptide repeat-containing protein n=1 Tax=Artemisia annua TaxID=35608 RepID=A0A2U1LF67_ARTAN|nr:Pentatricopeptide repeat-containing protein [Artemisia annua]